MTATRTNPWVTYLDALSTPLAPADRTELLQADPSDLAQRGFSGGEIAIIAIAKAADEIDYMSTSVDRAWNARTVILLEELAARIELDAR